MVSGHLAVKKNRWYAILCLRHPDGRRYDKWIATGLSYPGNKRKAEAMLIELRRQHFNSHITPIYGMRQHCFPSTYLTGSRLVKRRFLKQHTVHIFKSQMRLFATS